ncbi:MAG: hypothetical protein RTV31_00760 [Candidatus Thorarchaeota archaeon]
MNKKRICSLICIVGIVGMIASAVIIVSLNSVVTIRDLEIQNPDGTTGTAFVVFRPGITTFNEDIVNAFINGLVESDWRVEVITTSDQTPTNVTAYDLIVLGAPVNGVQPHTAMLAYLTRADFEGKPVQLILTMGGSGADAIISFRNATISANGVVHAELIFALLESGAANRAYTAGTEVTLSP